PSQRFDDVGEALAQAKARDRQPGRAPVLGLDEHRIRKARTHRGLADARSSVQDDDRGMRGSDLKRFHVVLRFACSHAASIEVTSAVASMLMSSSTLVATRSNWQ